MKKKLTSIFLSAVLISQVSVAPQISAERINNFSENIAKSEKANSKIVYALKRVGVTASLFAGLFLLHNHFGQSEDVPAASSVKPPVQIDDISLTNNTVHVVPLDQRISEFEKILDKYLNNSYSIQPDEIYRICNKAIPVLERESSLLRIEGPTIVVGDIHSNIGSLEFSVRKFLREVKYGKSILFLGDYVDRGSLAPGGPNGIKSVALLLQLKTMFPDKVFLLRGNHEDGLVNMTYGFVQECCQIYEDEVGVNVYETFNDVFNYLSLAAVVNNSTFCVHGGISPELDFLSKIENINKPLDYDRLSVKDFLGHTKKPDEYNTLAMDLLWSDPNDGNIRFTFNVARGKSCYYGRDAVNKFFKRNNLKRIVRAHETVNGHNDVFGDGSVITIFSAPKYSPKWLNIGEIMDINGDDIRYEQIRY